MDAYGAETPPPVNRNEGVTHADRVILIRTRPEVAKKPVQEQGRGRWHAVRIEGQGSVTAKTRSRTKRLVRRLVPRVESGLSSWDRTA